MTERATHQTPLRVERSEVDAAKRILAADGKGPAMRDRYIALSAGSKLLHALRHQNHRPTPSDAYVLAACVSLLSLGADTTDQALRRAQKEEEQIHENQRNKRHL